MFRSVGVLVYIVLSGVSPFLADSDVDTCANIVQGNYTCSFSDEPFSAASQHARAFMSSILIQDLK